MISPYFDELPLLRPVLTLNGVETCELGEDWLVYLDRKRTRYVIIPEGTRTNYASIPWWLRWLMSKVDPVLFLPSIVHDYLVQEFDYYGDRPVVLKTRNSGGAFVSPTMIKSPEPVDWFEAAEIFKQMIRIYKGRSVMLKSHLAYFGVWINGHWKKLWGEA